MAEQKSDETKPAVARLGARPFAGRAIGTSATRPPILRPAAPAVRPASGPFAPAPPVGSSALGTAAPDIPARSEPAPPALAERSAAPPELAAAGIEPPDVEPMEALAAMWEGAGSEVSPVTENPATPDPVSIHSPPDELSLGAGADAQQSWGDEIIALPEPTQAASLADPVAPPALESAWPEGDRLAVDAPASEVSDIGMPWAEGPSIPSADEVMAAEPTPAEVMAAEPAPPEAPSDVFASSTDHAMSAGGDGWPDPLLAEYAPYVAAPVHPREPTIDVGSMGANVSVPANPALDPIAAQPHSETAFADSASAFDRNQSAPEYSGSALDEAVDRAPELAAASAAASADDSSLEPAAGPQAAAYPARDFEPASIAAPVPETVAAPLAAEARASAAHEWRVSDALARLAERVRAGEIDVSSVAPDATEAAVLASVLASLLRGSTSR